MLVMGVVLPGATGILGKPSDKEKELHADLVACSGYTKEDECTGINPMKCEWMQVTEKCLERKEPPPPKSLSDAECQVFTSMSDCLAGIGCVYDGVAGTCHATPSVCSQITCGEERQPPQPLVCPIGFKKAKPEGACCFVCRPEDEN